MSETGPFISSLRQSRRENRWLWRAIVLSLLLHVTVWGGYELGKKEGWWDKWPVFAWLHRVTKPIPPPVPKPPPPVEHEPELTFLAVANPDDVAPAKPKFYSNNNSRQASETPKPDVNTPDIKGKQTDMIRTETAPRTLLTKAKPQPATKTEKNQKEAQPQKEQTQPLQPQPVVHAGDLAKGTPLVKLQQTEPQTPPRARTLAARRAQLPSQIQGERMYHQGGDHRVSNAAFDAKESPVGDYDAELEEAVQQKWDDLLNARNFAGDCVGRVTVHFYLNYDGSITEAKIVDPTTVATTWAFLCLEAITDPAPFARWPDQMRREIGANVREMTFTFDYY